MSFHFQKLPKFKNLRGKTKHNGWYKVYSPSVKTDIAIHHSLTKTGNSAAFANYHVGTLGWPEVAYHFVILKDGTIEWNHDLGVLSYHVGDSNKFSVGICLVGDFRTEEPTDEQKLSLYLLHEALKKDLPNYKCTRGHNEFPGYAWKQCPVFNYKAVIAKKPVAQASKPAPKPKEDDDMLEKAIVINAFPDFAIAEVLAARIKAPIYTRSALPAGKVAKELYVVGGTKDGLQADKIVALTGKDRFEVAENVAKFLK
ncbi:peptidoglycan recognition family protein [Cytobacillus oceanisediminis]|uniref:Autolysin n=1 Tax=Cytobacillus oceanisediminis 2691 TaxID=1196031 RepID=A0A169FM46_9BACI|nr:peptidoglycan recognition family protein [Cytobacillus oceanisediminis]AND39631.1 hypothetical protein A361_10940 [Cytobacillus oceanisediminis 2691]